MATNRHATALVLGDRGLLVSGASGAGKTTLALALVSRARLAQSHAAFVSDDQVLLEAASGRLIARAPASIAGLAERRGAGPLAVAHVASAVIDGLVELVSPEQAPRLEGQPWKAILGVRLPRLRLASGAPEASVLAVEAWLDNALAVAG
jgi:serine kinase of HPr protein (carbohydrate metabolism regulator)